MLEVRLVDAYITEDFDDAFAYADAHVKDTVGEELVVVGGELGLDYFLELKRKNLMKAFL